MRLFYFKKTENEIKWKINFIAIFLILATIYGLYELIHNI